MLLQDLYNTLSDTATNIAVKDLKSNQKTFTYLRKNGKINPEIWYDYSDREVCCWHCEPNLDDNSEVNWKSPCRVVIEVM